MNNVKSIFYQAGIKIVRYADNFVLMGKQITQTSLNKLKEILSRMELTINEEKSKLIQAKEEPFNFLGFTIRYDKDKYGRQKRYWNIEPSKKAKQKATDKLREYLRKSLHKTKEEIAKGINEITVGWMNYYTIPKVSYTTKAKRHIRDYLVRKLYKYNKRKSQKGSRRANRNAYQVLVDRYGLKDLTKMQPQKALVKA